MYDSEFCRGGQPITCSIGQLSRLRQHMAEASIGTLYRHLYRQCLQWQETKGGWYVIWRDFIAVFLNDYLKNYFLVTKWHVWMNKRVYRAPTHTICVFLKHQQWHYTFIIIKQKNMLQFSESYVNKCLVVTSKKTQPVYSGYSFCFSWMAIQEHFECISILYYILLYFMNWWLG